MTSNTAPTPSEQPSRAAPGSAEQWLAISERMSICARHLRSLIARLSSEIDLGEAQLSLLWACLNAPPAGLSQKDLARFLVVSPAHISGQVEQLRSQGLLTGRRNVHDRRRQHWQLTPQGHAKLQSLVDRLAGCTPELDGQFEPGELLTIVERLRSGFADRSEQEEDPTDTLSDRVPRERPGQLRGAA